MERTSTPGPERMYSVSSASPPASPRAPSTNRPRTGSGDQATTGRGGTGIPHRVNRGITPHGESDVAVACRPGNASPPLGTIKSDLPPSPSPPQPISSNLTPVTAASSAFLVRSLAAVTVRLVVCLFGTNKYHGAARQEG
jgi:hypothetical protein